MTEVKLKYALVTGASRGIGRAVSVQLAEMGYYVLINFQSNEAAAKETLELIRAKGSDGELMKFDVSNQEDVNQVLETWIEENKDKRIEVLINNAGIRKDQLMMFMTREEWDSVLNIGMGGFYNVTRLVLKGMHLNRYGRIVNVVSLSGIKGMPGQTNYSAAKGGMIAAAKALSQEVGRRGITVNSVAPGFIKTDMTEDIDEKDYKKLIPLNRFGRAEEVADAVCFLASPKASYITGQVLSINGGLYS